ncbi:hypothetical protein HK097_001795 [Rhizophlyctis rosea]|uniref:PTHB1 hairpin domain-containing protein n=1 Tax=Rhizophlyctis rosea TaxID=64517 RepID=A0AAD5SHH2_9FUNG|nr:hypothetical protein HK097_001795 [Rhizophlyctis rosea]
MSEELTIRMALSNPTLVITDVNPEFVQTGSIGFHYPSGARDAARVLLNDIESQSKSFQAIQAKLAEAFMRKSPVPLGELQGEFEQAYQKVSAISREYLQKEEELENARHRLSAGTSLMLDLMR